MSQELRHQDFRHVHLVTGRFAAAAVQRTANELSREFDTEFSVQVLPITVAALMTPPWIARHIAVPESAEAVVIPGYCAGDLTPLQTVAGRPIVIGPKDIRQLPEWFGKSAVAPDLSNWSIEIIAEINHVPQLEIDEVVRQARCLAADGANVIDLGCDPGGPFSGIADVVSAVRELDLRVSVDSWNAQEVAAAVDAGAELVLSVNSSNREAATEWGCEVVVVPDRLDKWESAETTMEFLARHGIPFRFDPVLEPIGLGFAASLERYMAARRRFPNVRMLMGIGNLTELTDVDSAGANMLLLGICQELGIESVLTTQVINWARTSVRECDVARRLARYAVEHGVPPKNLSDQLVMLRDPRLMEFGPEMLEQIASQIRDNNCRILVEGGLIHVMVAGHHLSGTDAYRLMQDLLERGLKNLDASHAFYLGHELCKAELAMHLGKHYEQDEPLRWGLLPPTSSPRHRRIGKPQ